MYGLRRMSRMSLESVRCHVVNRRLFDRSLIVYEVFQLTIVEYVTLLRKFMFISECRVVVTT